ncbi:MAG TPA: hemerythrin domain-containing protein [Kribbella sp.]
MSTTQHTEPDTHEMVLVHRVFRREFRLLPELIRRVGEGDTARAAVLAEHATDLVMGLHHHHVAEDDLLWPALLRQAKVHTDLVHRMEAQHTDLSAILDQVEELMPVWAAKAGFAERDQLVDALDKVSKILDFHLAEEEQKILPLVRKYLTVNQWKALGAHGAEAIDDKQKRLMFLGMILEDTSTDEERNFLSQMPAPVRVLWKVLGRRQYAAYMASIRTS